MIDAVISLLHILDAAGGPMPRWQINRQLADNGVKPLEVSGVISAAKRYHLIKVTRAGVELTPKGQRLNTEQVKWLSPTK